MSRYVMHDEHRWKIVSETSIDDAPAYELERRRGPGAPATRCFAWVSDCQPDAHEPRRVFRDSFGSLVFFPKRDVIEVREKRARVPFVTSIKGVIMMCARAKASNLARDRAFKRRTGKR